MRLTPSESTEAQSRIGVRSLLGRGKIFVDQQTGLPFQVIGFNHSSGTPSEAHTLFNAGVYDSRATSEELGKMKAFGTSVVRVFINGDRIGGTCAVLSCSPAERLNAAYVENVLDFLRQARKNKIRVTFTFGWTPANYLNLASALYPMPVITYPDTTQESLTGINGLFLSRVGLEADRLFRADIISEIKRKDSTLLSTIFSIDLKNEIAMQMDGLPFNRTEGVIQTADGGTYDMAVPAQRQQCVDANFVNWANYLADGIKAVDPQMLVTVSMYPIFALGYPNFYSATASVGAAMANPNPQGYRDDTRYPPRPLTLSLYASKLDYLEVHMYDVGPAYDVNVELASMEFEQIDKLATILVIGEMGAIRGNLGIAYSTASQACTALINHRKKLSAKGFSGFLTWTWNWWEQPSGHYDAGQPLSFWTGVGKPSDTDRTAIASCLLDDMQSSH